VCGIKFTGYLPHIYVRHTYTYYYLLLLLLRT